VTSSTTVIVLANGSYVPIRLLVSAGSYEPTGVLESGSYEPEGVLV
jgi:hypothetical protein